jgi:MFS family permease
MVFQKIRMKGAKSSKNIPLVDYVTKNKHLSSSPQEKKQKKSTKKVIESGHVEVPHYKFVLATINIFFYFFGFNLVKAMLPVLVDERLQLPAFIITFLFSLRYIACAIYDGFIVHVTKKLSLKAATAIGFIMMILVFAGFYTFKDFLVYSILFVFLGIATGFNELTFLNKSQSWGRRGIQMYYGSFFAGMFFAFLLSGFILERLSVEWLFIISVLSFSIPFIIIMLTSKPHHVEHVPLKTIIMVNFLSEEAATFSHLQKNMVFVFLVKLFAEGFNSMKELFVPLIILSSLMGGKEEISLVLAITLLPTIFIQRHLKTILKFIPPVFFFIGHKRRVLGFSLLLLAIGSIGIPFATNLVMFGVCIGLCMIGFALLEPLLNIIILKYYPDNFERENALLHISAQLGKWFTLFVAVGITYYFEQIAFVFIFPGVIFVALLVWLFIDSVRHDEIKGQKNITILPESLFIRKKPRKQKS